MTIAAADDLREVLTGSPYASYSYAYPHKTAYRPLDPPRDLAEVWREEARDALFLYMHIPFCEFRCGFCNLFTLARPEASLTRRYLDAVRRQAEANRVALPDARFVRFAIGGGTPTFLTAEELAELFATVNEVAGAETRTIPGSCEASPATITPEKLSLLREQGVTRLSMGIQSFDERDAHAIGRPQRRGDVDAALKLIDDARFPVVNLDLIYGGETQTPQSWRSTVNAAIHFGPQEIYLYPLYVRPLTGLAQLEHEWDDFRLSLYRDGRDLLLERGYEQVSMRMFRRPTSADDEGPSYCCQNDGMLGLGCGARSYTTALHYSREYAVGTQARAGILADYVARSAADFARVDYGIALNDDEQRRRLIILSLLQVTGLSQQFYRQRFAGNPLDDYPQLLQLVEHGWATSNGDFLRLTAAGIERSDAIGPWLYSRAVKRRSEEYAWS